MALAIESDGSQTAVIDTEHSLASPTTNKTRVLAVDLVNMVNGDIVELRIKTKTRAGGTERVAYVATFTHTQDEDVVYSVPVPSVNGATFTLKQTAGTGRVFEWAIYDLG
jgi:hypothetical protein